MAKQRNRRDSTIPLTFEAAIGIAARSFQNGKSLVADARILFENQRWPRVLYLCLIAEEEFAKCILSIGAAVKISLDEFGQTAELRYRKRFCDHKLKSAAVQAFIDLVGANRPHAEILRTLEGGDQRSIDQEVVKLGSLYADFNGYGSRSPYEVVATQSQVELTLNYATELYAVAEAGILQVLERVQNRDSTFCRTWMDRFDQIL